MAHKKTRRAKAKCRQCDNQRDCKLWVKEINKTDPDTYSKPWETCGRFRSTSYDSDGPREWEYMHNLV